MQVERISREDFEGIKRLANRAIAGDASLGGLFANNTLDQARATVAGVVESFLARIDGAGAGLVIDNYSVDEIRVEMRRLLDCLTGRTQAVSPPEERQMAETGRVEPLGSMNVDLRADESVAKAAPLLSAVELEGTAQPDVGEQIGDEQLDEQLIEEPVKRDGFLRGLRDGLLSAARRIQSLLPRGRGIDEEDAAVSAPKPEGYKYVPRSDESKVFFGPMSPLHREDGSAFRRRESDYPTGLREIPVIDVKIIAPGSTKAEIGRIKVRQLGIGSLAAVDELDLRVEGIYGSVVAGAICVRLGDPPALRHILDAASGQLRSEITAVCFYYSRHSENNVPDPVTLKLNLSSQTLTYSPGIIPVLRPGVDRVSAMLIENILFVCVNRPLSFTRRSSSERSLGQSDIA